MATRRPPARKPARKPAARKPAARTPAPRPARKPAAASPRKPRKRPPTDPLMIRAGFLEEELGESTTHSQVVTGRVVELEEELGELRVQLASLEERYKAERAAHAATRERATLLEAQVREHNRRLDALADALDERDLRTTFLAEVDENATLIALAGRLGV